MTGLILQAAVQTLYRNYLNKRLDEVNVGEKNAKD